MNPILVTSTEESTGKTAISLALASLAADDGRAVGYMKPKGTRLQSATGKTLDEDPMLAREVLGLETPMHEMEPIVYSPTFVEEAIRGREDPPELRERIREAYDAIAADSELVVIEGGGSYETGGIVDLTDPDIAELLDARVLLVTRYDGPGDVDEILAAAARFGDSLGGVLFNAVSDDEFDGLTEDVIPFLESRDIPVFGALPEIADLSGVTIAELAESIGAEILTDEAPTDARVERFSVGAMSSDAALRGFRRTRDAAVITGGDRPDIQTAALEAPGVKCLVLTGGFGPTGAVVGRAEEEGKPLLVVQANTRTTVDRVEDVIQSGRTRDPETVRRMRELLTDSVDVGTILALAE